MVSTPSEQRQQSDNSLGSANVEQSVPGIDEIQELSAIACLHCRKRKVKCSRDLPTCILCQESGQDCHYPEQILKPGPKLGSVHPRRKRRREDSQNYDNKATKTDHVVVQDKTESLEQNDETAEEAVAIVADSPTSLRQAPNMQSLSFIIHPSHESCNPKEKEQQLCSLTQPSLERTILLTNACSLFGIPFSQMTTLFVTDHTFM